MNEKRPKVIFLDIDGVLNCQWTKERFHCFIGVDPEKVKLLNEIIERTGAKLVFSSTWRKSLFPRDEVLAYLKQQGLTEEFIGETPHVYQGFSSHRGNEIAEWMLENNGKFGEWVALDDDPRVRQLTNYVLTDFCAMKNGVDGVWEPDPENSGLTRMHVEAAVEILGEK